MNRRTLFKLLAAIPLIGSIPFIKRRAIPWYERPEVQAAIQKWVEDDVEAMINRVSVLAKILDVKPADAFMVDGKWERGTSFRVPDFEFDYGKIEYPTGNVLTDPVPLTRKTLAEAKKNADEFWGNT
jgi:hypothetical protein